MASFFKQKRQVKQREKKKEDESQSKSKTPDYIESSLSANLEIVKKKTGKSPDIIIRTLKIGLNPEIKTTILYVQGLIDNPSVTDFIIESIMKNPHLSKNILPLEAMEIISEDVVSLGGVERVTDWEKLFLTLLSGDTIIFIDEVNVALVASTRGGESARFRSQARI